MDVVLEALLAESDIQTALGEAGITKASMEAAVKNARGTQVSEAGREGVRPAGR